MTETSPCPAVEALGVPHPTPYLAGKTAADFRRGVNFAFGGATALDLHFFESRGLMSFVPVSLRNQTVWFNDVVRRVGAEPEQRKSMATSVFLVGEIGVNDYFIGLNENRTVGEVHTFVPHVVSAIRSVITVSFFFVRSRLRLCSRSAYIFYTTRAVQDVIAAGASTVVVPGMIPLGCEPQLLTLYRGSVDAAGYDRGSGCIRSLNGLAELHNRELRRVLGGLRRAHPGTTIVYADLYRAVTDIIASPREYGFRHSPLDACCGGGGGAYNYDDAAFCGAARAAACADPSEYVSWDGVHYTDAANRLIACSVLDGSHSHGADAMTLSNSSATMEDWLHRIGCV